jgi:hypothetical protein
MKKNTSKKQIASKGEKQTRAGFAFYIGIDLGDKHSDLCVLDPSGEVGKEFRLRMKEEDLPRSSRHRVVVPHLRPSHQLGRDGR